MGCTPRLSISQRVLITSARTPEKPLARELARNSIMARVSLCESGSPTPTACSSSNVRSLPLMCRAFIGGQKEFSFITPGASYCLFGSQRKCLRIFFRQAGLLHFGVDHNVRGFALGENRIFVRPQHLVTEL